MHEAAKAQRAMRDDPAMGKAKDTDERCRHRCIEDERAGGRRGVGAQDKTGKTREAHGAAYPQHALWPAVIFRADQHLRAAPETARDLEIEAVPALIHDHEVFLRQEEAHQAAEQDLLLIAFLA